MFHYKILISIYIECFNFLFCTLILYLEMFSYIDLETYSPWFLSFISCLFVVELYYTLKFLVPMVNLNEGQRKILIRLIQIKYAV